MGGIAGGSYRLMLFDLPGFFIEVLRIRLYLRRNWIGKNVVTTFMSLKCTRLPFFDKYVKGNKHTILDTGEVVDARAKLEKFPPH
jgi:hypothetical protein